MEVVYLAPGNAIRLHGALGPLASQAATGSMEIQLSAADGGARLEVTYAVAGYPPAGMDSVLKDLFTRLKNYIEHGDPAAK